MKNEPSTVQTNDKNNSILFFQKAALMLLLLSPILGAVGFGTYVLIASKEVYTIHNAAEIQAMSSEIIYHPLYFDIRPAYTYESVGIRLSNTFRGKRPEIMVTGSSRIGEITEKMFLPQYRGAFFNAGMSITTVPQHLHLIRHILSQPHKPRLIILCLDVHIFSDGFYKQIFRGKDVDTMLKRMDKEIKREYLSGLWSYWRNPLEQIVTGKFSVRQFVASQPIDADSSRQYLGLKARLFAEGHRSDGSYTRGKNMGLLALDSLQPRRWAQEFSHVLQEKKVRYSEYMSYEHTKVCQVDSTAIANLETMLSLCQKQGIYVIGCITPVPQQILELMATSSEYQYVKTFSTLMQSIFAKFQFTCIDALQPQTYNGSDFEFIDPTHASERSFAKIMITAAKQNDTLRKYIDTSGLHGKLESNPSRFEVFSRYFAATPN